MPYYIKRNGKVKGPFTHGQIKVGIRTGKLYVTDLISNSQNSSWKTVGQTLENARNSKPSHPTYILFPSQAGCFDNPQEKHGVKRPALKPKQSQSIRWRLHTKPKHSGTQPITHNSRLEARFANSNSITKGRSFKKPNKASSMQTLDISLSIRVLVVMLVGGAILFGPSISHSFERQKARRFARQAFSFGIKLVKLEKSGIHLSPQYDRLLDQGSSLPHQLEGLKRD